MKTNRGGVEVHYPCGCVLKYDAPTDPLPPVCSEHPTSPHPAPDDWNFISASSVRISRDSMNRILINSLGRLFIFERDENDPDMSEILDKLQEIFLEEVDK